MKRAIIHARILKETGEVTENGYAVFDESGILKLGEGELEDSADQIIEGRGQTLMPGLIDCHVHLGFGGMSPDTPEIEQGLSIAMQLKEFAKYDPEHGHQRRRGYKNAQPGEGRLSHRSQDHRQRPGNLHHRRTRVADEL